MEAVRADLETYGQGHLLQHLDQLEASERDELYRDISELNLKRLSECWRRTQPSLSDSGEVKDERLKPLDSSIIGSTARDKRDIGRWMNLGES